MTGATVEYYDYGESYDEMINNDHLSARAAKYAVEYFGEKPFENESDLGGSIDMGNVSVQCPAIHMLVDITDGVPIPLHTAEFREAAASPYADKEILRMGKALALTGLDLLADEEFRKAVRAEFDQAIQ